ncbi:LacI family DNA-binding transcriptional regulator [Armatimonas rosea]|uniref:DNA-binding LacI/PurR family transcriptional regulator n=1 Tax=Armatimonas rosea TaxID=685828 RepID=A0A7W9SQN5_ARMRO|nr:LacI family DNA-binding transcriptional regulator [Armatimonas rosea]MBB6050248.1 DNA-binding LacI/PurR family transcriptional regulator [Armatimonas rosea]
MSRVATPASRRIRLEDVARQAGVSVATASQALSEKSGQYRISTDVIERVRQTAQELDYSPNRLVRSMQGRGTHILSFFNGYRTRTPQDLYMNTLGTALERAAGRLGYDLLIHCDFSRSPQEIYQHLNGGIADAVLFFAPQPDDPLLALLKNSRLKTVLIGGQVEGSLPQVVEDVEGGMQQVAQQLLKAGHREIGVLFDDSKSPDFPQRVGFLRQELARQGVALPETCITDFAELAAHLEAKTAPTALFCPRDRLAYLLLDQCTEHGIRIPEQLSLVGYDGLPWETQSGHTVASVKVDIEALAEAAIAQAVALVQGESPLPQVQYLPTSFLAGTTLGAVPTGAASQHNTTPGPRYSEVNP